MCPPCSFTGASLAGTANPGLRAGGYPEWLRFFRPALDLSALATRPTRRPPRFRNACCRHSHSRHDCADTLAAASPVSTRPCRPARADSTLPTRPCLHYRARVDPESVSSASAAPRPFRAAHSRPSVTPPQPAPIAAHDPATCPALPRVRRVASTSPIRPRRLATARTLTAGGA